MEKPNSMPVCCEAETVWVDNVPGKEYCYCRNCKKEVTESKKDEPLVATELWSDNFTGIMTSMNLTYNSPPPCNRAESPTYGQDFKFNVGEQVSFGILFGPIVAAYREESEHFFKVETDEGLFLKFEHELTKVDIVTKSSFYHIGDRVDTACGPGVVDGLAYNDLYRIRLDQPDSSGRVFYFI